MNQNNTLKRFGKISFRAFVIIVNIVLVLSIGASILSKIQGSSPSLFGFTFHIVVTGSMEPEINVKDFVIAKNTDISQVEIGDDVVFIATWEQAKGKQIVHRVVDIKNVNGQIQLITAGINTNGNDPLPITEIIGRVVVSSGFIGKILVFFSMWQNWAFLIAVLLIISFAIKQIKIIKSAGRGNEEEV